MCAKVNTVHTVFSDEIIECIKVRAQSKVLVKKGELKLTFSPEIEPMIFRVFAGRDYPYITETPYSVDNMLHVECQ
jgi:hypothetical protein